MIDVDKFIQELRKDELSDMLYLEVKEIVSREQKCESVDEYIEQVLRRNYARAGLLRERRSS